VASVNNKRRVVPHRTSVQASEVGGRRSGGTRPDAPWLRSGALIHASEVRTYGQIETSPASSSMKKPRWHIAVERSIGSVLNNDRVPRAQQHGNDCSNDDWDECVFRHGLPFLITPASEANAGLPFLITHMAGVASNVHLPGCFFHFMLVQF